MVDCILLSAGTSTRYGSPKALAKINNTTVIQNTLTQLLKSNINNIIIVLGAYADKIQPFVLNHKRVKVVYNNHYNFGQTSSFKCGLSSLREDTNGILLLPVDFPFITYETINTLIDEFQKKEASIIIPSFNHRKGHPPLFDISHKQEFLALKDTEGLNSVGHQHKEKTQILSVQDEGVLLSFNTPEEFAEIQKKRNCPN